MLRNPTQDSCIFVREARSAVVALLFLLPSAIPNTKAQSPAFAGNSQHTAIFSAPAQHLNAVRWTTPIDLHYTGFAHYGAPLITPSNTILVPIKTSTGFRVSAFEGSSGRLKYTLTNDYIMPPIATNGWIPVYQPAIATPVSGARLYYPGAGGTINYVENPDSDAPSNPVRQCFYTNLIDYSNNAMAFNGSIFLNTPITADTNGDIFFGFRIQETAPAPLNTTNGGFARIDPAGNATYVLVNTAANDVRITRDSHNCAPALSNDGTTLYVAVKGTNSGYAYLLGLDSTNLSTKYKVFLRDPRSSQPGSVPDDGTASPMVAPDDDVFFGILANPNNGSRGFLLHFSPDLQIQKPPGGFGWDYTAAIVPTNMVPSYTGPSSYLLFSKYNNYAGGDGNAINRIALLDPNVTQTDPHPSANGLSEMREVLTAIGCTPDEEYITATNPLPFAVREWCINTAAVNPATKSVFAPSEDGHLYRWNLASNALDEVVALDPGVGEPYVPTVIGPDGTVYTLNAETFFAIGAPTNFSFTLYSSAPDLRYTVVGQPVIFTAVVTNLSPVGPMPSGTVTFQDVTYRGTTRVTNILAVNVPVSGGTASVTNSALIASTNSFGNHFITAIYGGDTNLAPANATLIQKVHASGTTMTLTSAISSTTNVTFSAAVTSSSSITNVPTGMVSFWDGAKFLAQVPLNSGGMAAVTVTNFAITHHSISANYASDTLFASSSANLSASPLTIFNPTILPNGHFQFTFTNSPAVSFSVLGSSDVTEPRNSWMVLGSATETAAGEYQFTDDTIVSGSRFYLVRSP
jgi:hypothetical protein